MPPVKAKIGSTSVIRALSRLGFNDRGVRVTTEKVAKYLAADTEEVHKLLVNLEAARLVRRRRRAGEQVWHPWEGQR